MNLRQAKSSCTRSSGSESSWEVKPRAARSDQSASPSRFRTTMVKSSCSSCLSQHSHLHRNGNQLKSHRSSRSVWVSRPMFENGSCLTRSIRISLIDPMSGMIANPSVLSVPHSLQKSNLACWLSQNLARRPSLIGQSSAPPSLYHLQEALKRRRGFVQTRFVSARKPTLTMIFVSAFRLFPGAFVSTGCREDGDEPGRPWPASECASIHPDRGHSGRLHRKGHSPACRRRTVRQGELIFA